VKRRKRAMSGKVVSSRLRRPKRSMVKTAGSAKSQFITPKPKEARRAEVSLKPLSTKIEEE